MSVPIEPFPMVREGAEDHPVDTLQHLLRAQGETITVDGVFGTRTDNAVRNLQRNKGLTIDGLVGPHTWSALLVLLSQGSTGDAVCAVQAELKFRNLSADPSSGPALDGIFGPKTDASVREFQQPLGVTVDGMVGPLTWRGLISGMYSS